MTLKFNRALEVVSCYMFMQNIIELSTAVHELSRNGKESENTVLWPSPWPWPLTYDFQDQ